MPMKLSTCLSITLIALAGAAQAAPAHHRPAARQAGPQQIFPVGTDYRLETINGRPVPAGGDFTIKIDDTFRGSGSAGCNRWSAALYPLKNGRLAMGPVARTRMACAPGIMALEKRYLTALHSGPYWRLERPWLILKTTMGTLKFRRAF